MMTSANLSGHVSGQWVAACGGFGHGPAALAWLLIRAAGGDGPLARLNKLVMHRPDRVRVLTDDRLDVTSTFSNVSAKPPDEAEVCLGVDEDLDIEHVEQLGV